MMRAAAASSSALYCSASTKGERGQRGVQREAGEKGRTVDHALNLLLGKPTLVVGDGNLRKSRSVSRTLEKTQVARKTHLVRLASGLVGGRDVQDTVGVDIEGNLDLGNSTRCRGDARQLKFTQKVVVLGASALTCEGKKESA